MKLFYLVNQYPKVSHAFIRREIAALEQQGLDIVPCSIRPCDAQSLSDEQDKQDAQRTRVILDAGLVGLVLAGIGQLLRARARLIRAIAVAIAMGRKSERGVLVHLIYLLEACLLVQWMGKQHATHVHAHFGTNPAAVAHLAKTIANVTYSFTLHGPEEYDRPGSLSLDRKVADASFIATVSSFGRSQLYRWCDYEHWHKIKVVRCGVDDAFLHGEPKPVPTEPNLVCVGRLCEQKGQSLLVEAMAKLRDDGVSATLTLVGDGEMRPNIETLIDQHDMSDRITITGWQSGDQIRDHLECARAMVLPSFAEGLPVVIMEALARKRPVITTYIAGIPELVTPECGWLVPAGHVDALADAMRQAVLAEPDMLAAMGESGRSRVAQMHNIQSIAGQLAQYFASVISQTQPQTQDTTIEPATVTG